MSGRSAPGWLAGLMAVGLVAFLTAGWVLAGELVHDVPPLTVAALRTGSTFVVITLLVLARRPLRRPARVAAGRWPAVLVLAGLGFLIYYSATMLGITRIGAPATSIVVGLLPCVTLLLGLAFFHERAGALRIAGTVLAVAAAATYGLSHGDPIQTDRGAATLAVGVALAAVGTVAYSWYGYHYRRTMGDLPSLASLPAITGAATVGLIPLVWLHPDGWELTGRQVLGVVVLGVVFTAPVFLLSHELVLVRGPLFTNSVAVCVPFLTRGAQWVLGVAEPFAVWELVLFTLAAGGVLMAVRADSRRAVEPAPDAVPDGPDAVPESSGTPATSSARRR